MLLLCQVNVLYLTGCSIESIYFLEEGILYRWRVARPVGTTGDEQHRPWSREARNLGIPTICLIDTDGNPELADIPIPGNDDSMRAIDIVVRELCAAVTEGRSQRSESAATSGDREGDGMRGDAAAETAPAGRRRSSRSQFRARGRAEDSDTGSASRAEAAPVENA